MAERQYNDTSETRRSGAHITKRVMVVEACGACMHLRRKCNDECIFAPYFGVDQGTDKFAAVHKVFGASNVRKLLLNIPPNYRQQAVTTISYEAEARLSDPVNGCVSTIMALQQQVATIQAELNMLKNQLANPEFSTYATTITQNNQQQQPNFNVEVQPVYSNNSLASTTNLMNMNNFNPSTTDLMNVSNFYPGFDLPTEPSRHF